MELSDLGALPRLIRRLRRRIRLAWLLDTLQLAAPLLAGLAVILLAAQWLPGVPSPGGVTVVAVVVLAVVVILVSAALLRLPDRTVARAADRGLGTKDAFTTALEFDHDTEPFRQRIRDRAARLAERGDVATAVVLPVRRRPVLTAAALIPLAIVLSVATSPRETDEARRRAHAEVLATAEAELDAAAGERPDEQLGQLADQLGGLSPEEQTALAERLEALAATQAVGDPETAAALQEAADALAAGDEAAAASALAAAGEASATSAAASASSAALGETAGAARRAADSVAGAAGAGESDPAAGQGAGQGQGEGEGQGQGQGEGAGNGAGSGSGSGAGSGTGGSGGGSGTGGATSNSSGAAGQGGAGQGGRGQGNAGEDAPELDTIFDPAHGDGGDELTVGGGQGSGEGGTIGTQDAVSNDGQARVDIAAAISEYSQAATAALDHAVVAPSDRRLVTDYFDHLQQRS